VPRAKQRYKLTQKEVWLTEVDFKKFSAKAAPMNLLGYAVVEEGKPLGTYSKWWNNRTSCFAASRWKAKKC
jgi:hypothetical protein